MYYTVLLVVGSLDYYRLIVAAIFRDRMIFVSTTYILCCYDVQYKCVMLSIIHLISF